MLIFNMVENRYRKDRNDGRKHYRPRHCAALIDG